MRLFATFFVAVLLLTPALRAQREKFPMDDLDFIEKNWPAVKKTNTGIRYIILKEGEGQPPKPGDNVEVLYEGKLLNGTPFDKNQDKDHPFKFRVGRQTVIAGWDQVLQLMKTGEKRLVFIPPELAYGTQGQAPHIPRDASLVFTIELLKINRQE